MLYFFTQRRGWQRLLLTTLALLTIGLAEAQPNIDRVEYFLDADPGFGQGTALPITPATTINNLSFQVPLGSLAPGFHSLYIRSRAGGSRWSETTRRLLYIDNVAATAPNLNRVEYFVDTDPGFGQASSVTVTGTTATGLGFVVPLGNLSFGLHALYFRSRDANGRWSQTQRRSFVVDPTSTATLNPTLQANAHLYPNPTAQTATLKLAGVSGSADVKLTTMLGQTVRQRTVEPRAGLLQTTFDMQDLPTGVYLVHVQTTAGAATLRLLRE